eukprot:scaffold636_cov64-Cylindrotheca_fusiformis.AAC.3
MDLKKLEKWYFSRCGFLAEVDIVKGIIYATGRKLKPKRPCGTSVDFCLLKKEEEKKKKMVMMKSRKTGIPMRIQWIDNHHRHHHSFQEMRTPFMFLISEMTTIFCTKTIPFNAAATRKPYFSYIQISFKVAFGLFYYALRTRQQWRSRHEDIYSRRGMNDGHHHTWVRHTCGAGGLGHVCGVLKDSETFVVEKRGTEMREIVDTDEEKQ